MLPGRKEGRERWGGKKDEREGGRERGREGGREKKIKTIYWINK